MKIKNLLTTNFFLMLSAILLQQVVVASSSYWLAAFAQNLRISFFSWFLLGAYLASLLIPYLPGALSHYYQSLWNFEVLEAFYDRVLVALKGQVGLWNHEAYRLEKESLLVKDGPQFLNDLSFYIFDVFSIALNAIFNILVVIWLLDTEFLAAYFCGLLITVIVLQIQKQKHENLASNSETQKNEITMQLSSAWDHWTLDNQVFLNSWNEIFGNKKLKYKNSIKALSAQKEMGAVLLSIVSFIPTLIVTIHFAARSSSSFPELLNLTVLLPRLFMILGNTTSLIYLIRDFTIMKSRAKVLLGMENKRLDPQWGQRIQERNIQILGDPGLVLSSELKEIKYGYWTVVGANGSGKSSWLMKLKQELGDRACYLPPKSSLGLNQIEKNLSTGQKIKAQINLALNSNVQVLLLDEWDANLDVTNRNEILATLMEFGRKLCVIDIRHRI